MLHHSNKPELLRTPELPSSEIQPLPIYVSETYTGRHLHEAAYLLCADVTQVRAELVILKPSLTFLRNSAQDKEIQDLSLWTCPVGTCNFS